MKVKELKELLSQFDDELDVVRTGSIPGGYEKIQNIGIEEIYDTFNDNNKITVVILD